MKVLIIENQYELDESLQAFLKDNPDLFESVNEQTFCAQRPMRDLMQYIPEADTIMIATTFMESNQIMEYIEAFCAMSPEAPRYNFFVHRFVNTINDWGTKDSCQYNGLDMRAGVIQLLQKGHKLYNFEDSREGPEIDDGLVHFGIGTRQKSTHHEIKYDEQSGLFYIPDHERYSLTEMKEDYGN